MKMYFQEINNRRIYVIAEIGNNHNGDFNRAIEMINEAIDAGADCVKFQMRHLDKSTRKESIKKRW